jgi:uncharacterized protein YegL
VNWLIIAAVIVFGVGCPVLLLLAVGGVIVVRRSMHVVPTGYVGLVTRRWGRPHPEERFEVRTHGSAGPQAGMLEANVIRLRPPWLYHVEHYPLTTVRPGAIGVVVARMGTPVPPDRQLARHVECGNFSDARAFLLGGGEAGRQPRILTSGSYSINPWVFEVLTVDTIGNAVKYDLTADDLKEISIPPANTGVVTVHEGRPREKDQVVGPCVAGHASFQYPDRFLAAGGMIGTQEETLHSGGVYRINPWFAGISLMPTKELLLHWRSSGGKPSDNFDAELDRIEVSVDGVKFMFDVSQTVRIPPETAPMLVARLGDAADDGYGYTASRKPAPIKRFVEGVLSHIVEGNVLTIAREYSAVEFIVSHAAIQSQLETNVKHALAGWGVEAGQTTLSTFEVDDPRLVEHLLDAAAAEQRRNVLTLDKDNVEIERDIESVRQQIERGRLRLRSAELEDQIELLGKDRVALERFLAQVAKVKVPRTVVAGGDAEGILNSLPLPAVMEMVHDALGRRQVVEISPGHNAQPIPAGPTAQPRRLAPVYIVLDESSGVWVQALNAAVTSVCGALAAAPQLAGAVRLSVVGYAGDVTERLALQEVRVGVNPSQVESSHLWARGTVRFGAAFEWLLERVPRDIQQLKDQNFMVNRPQVLFLTGAEPTDGVGWHRAHRQLVDRKQTLGAPHIVACGIGQATARTIASIATQTEMAFVACEDELGLAVARFSEFVRAYVLSLGRAALDGGQDTHIRCPDGFRLAHEIIAEGGSGT